MGFTPATIVAPNVPDKLDPLIFLTTPPRSKIQEQAQEQARALGAASLRGMSPQEIQQLVLGNAPSRKPDTIELSKAEIAELQDAKTAFIPKFGADNGPYVLNPTIDYPYMFPNIRSRLAYSYMNISAFDGRLNGLQPMESRRSSRIPVIELSIHDYANFDASTIEKHAELIEEFGMVKFRCTGNGVATVRVPFTQDFTGFKVQNQYCVADSTDFDYTQAKRGFFRALIRFHTSYGGVSASESASPALPKDDVSAWIDDSTRIRKRLMRLPTFERRAIDFFRMFHIVELRGGVAEVVRRKEWAQVGRELGYSSALLPTLSTTMRNVYMRVLLPFRQWLQLHADIDIRLLPLLDVADDTAKFSKLVKSTMTAAERNSRNTQNTSGAKMDKQAKNGKPADDSSSGGWKKLSYGIVAYTRIRPVELSARTVQTVNTQKTACYTLRSFKYFMEGNGARENVQTASKTSPSVNELESQFLNLPEFYQTSVLSPPIKLYGFPPYVKLVEAYRDKKGKSQVTLGDISDLPLRNLGATWPALISEDIDDFVVPWLIAGNAFSTTDWEKPNAGTCHVSILLEGAGSTFYVKSTSENIDNDMTANDNFVDQFVGDIVVISPNAKYMRWRHDYNTSAEFNIMQPSNWLIQAFEDATTTKFINIQSLVSRVCTDEELEVKSTVKTQTLHVLKYMRQKEIDLLKQYQDLVGGDKNGPQLMPPTEIVTKSGEHRYFSYVRLDGILYTCEEFIEMFKSKKGNGDEKKLLESVELCTAYGSSPDAFFDKLENCLKNKSAIDYTSDKKWHDSVCDIFGNKARLPSESEIMKLKESAPSGAAVELPTFDSFIVLRLARIVDRLHEWISSSDESERLDLGNELIAATNGAEVDEFLKKFQHYISLKGYIWNRVMTAMDSPRPADSLLSTVTELLSQRDILRPSAEDERKFLLKIQEVCIYVIQVAYLARPKAYIPSPAIDSLPITDIETAMQFRDEGVRLGFSLGSQVMNAIHSWIENLVRQNERLERILGSLEALRCSRIASFDSENKNLLRFFDADKREKFERLKSHLRILDRMNSNDVMNRPLRSEVSGIEDIYAVAACLGELDSWLAQAKQLPWSAIYAQIKAMMEGTQLEVIVPVSNMDIYNLYSRIFQLVILPDDIAQVRVTFEKTLENFKTQPAELLFAYGFLP